MLDPVQFGDLKRQIARRLLSDMPDAALGELIHTMREMLDHYEDMNVAANGLVAHPHNAMLFARMKEILSEATSAREEEETQEARQVAPLMQEEDAADLRETVEAPTVPLTREELETVTAPVYRPPAIASRQMFLQRLKEARGA